MANKKEKNQEGPGLKSNTKHGIMAIVFFVLALFFLMSAFDMTGIAGKFIYEKLYYLLGVGYILLPALLVLLGSSFVRSETPEIGWRSAISAVMFLLSGLGLIDIAGGSPAQLAGRRSGGLLGEVLSIPLVSLFDVYASIIFLGAILIISILVIFDTKLDLLPFFKKIWDFITRRKVEEEEAKSSEAGSPDASEEVFREERETETTGEKIKKALGIKKGEDEEEEIPIKKRRGGLVSTYVPPPLSLLEEDQGKPNTGDIKANANIIKRTLLNFGIEVEMDEVTVGPTVTRYALKPAEGMKLSRIVALQNDLSLALAAHPIRIEAPIPGKSLVGIEIPNRTKSLVGLATLLADDKFQNSSKPLTIALGRNIGGKSIFGNLAKMPHCLVAGTTGSGKSVAIHSMITSLLYRNGPDDLKFILIDPKRVELTLYNNIPHLLTPVITDPKKTILALKWAAKEMDRRYDILEAESVRDIESYHNNVYSGVAKTAKGGSPDASQSEAFRDRLPYIIIIIDELADIMSSYPRELESAIVRLAQMSRAVGIHLIISTQRPEVNVITGLIKANIPARVALKVSSQVDSRTILDAGGAEKLLGAGDMLYASGDAQPERLQSAFISETEVKKVVNYLADAYKDEILGEITLTTGSISADKSIFSAQGGSALGGESLYDEDSEEDDELYEEARACVIEAGKASTSYLQRKLKLGYARAARLMDKLEERGVIGPGEGAKPREVLEKIERTETGDLPAGRQET